MKRTVGLLPFVSYPPANNPDWTIDCRSRERTNVIDVLNPSVRNFHVIQQ